MKYIKLVLVALIGILILIGCSKDERNENEDNQSDAENEISNVEQNQIEENQIEEANSIEEQEEAEQLSPEVLAFLEKFPEPPANLEGLVNQTPGPFAMHWKSEDYERVAKELAENIEPLPKDASDEQLDLYFNYIYSLVADEFPDPQDTIKKWEFGSFGNPDLPDSRFHFKENYNIEVLLDASGSMGAYIGDKTMMEIAKESINNFLQSVPEEANVSFRVYGHKGTSDFGDKPMSCEAIEQVYGYEPYNEESFQEELDNIQPAGWTPLADALEQAKESLKDFDTENHTNLIYVVSDGIETCDGDPVQVAKSLADSNAKPIINIIGFNVDSEAQNQLKEMAEVSGGIFALANNQNELEEEFKRAEKVLEAWEEWKKDSLRDVENIRVQSTFDILEVTNDWYGKTRKQFLGLTNVIDKAYQHDLITLKQHDSLDSRRNRLDKLVLSIARDVESSLKQIRAETIEDMKKDVEDRFKQNTNE